MIDFNKLNTFITIVDNGSVSAAARKLNRTQSAISQQIQILENEIGFSLFETLRGGILLTKEGRELYNNTIPSFTQIAMTVGKIRGSAENLNGTLKIGASPSVGHYIVLPYIQQFKLNHSNVSIELVLGTDEALEELLLQDKIDLSFMINFEKRERFAVTPFTQFEEYLVCTPKYFETFKKRLSVNKVTVDHLDEASLIDFGPESPNIRHWLKKNSKKYRNILGGKSSDYIVEDNECVKRLTLSDAGMSMLPNYMIIKELQSKKLLKVFPQSKPTLVGLDYALRKKKNSTMLINEFKKILKKACNKTL